LIGPELGKAITKINTISVETIMLAAKEPP